MTTIKDSWWKRNIVILIASVASIAWIITGLLFGWFANSCSGTATYRTFSCLGANEWGDFLAGLFSPLAFIWLVATVWLQRSELAAQRLELQLNRNVANAQRKEAERQAEFIGQQTQILLQAKIDREHEDMFDNCVALIASRLRNYPHAWNFYEGNSKPPNVAKKVDFSPGRGAYDGKDDRTVIALTAKTLRFKTRSYRTASNPSIRAQSPYDFAGILQAIAQGSDGIKQLPSKFEIRAKTIELEALREYTEFIISIIAGQEIKPE